MSKEMANRDKFKFFYALSLVLQLGFLIAIPLLVFLLAGIFLDKKLNSSPLWLIVFVILSLMFIYFEIRYVLLPLLQKHK